MSNHVTFWKLSPLRRTQVFIGEIFLCVILWCAPNTIWPLSVEPFIRLKTQLTSCLLSQTGLRCHGNMIWRSTYWDSAGRQWTVPADRGFSLPLVEKKLHCALFGNLLQAELYKSNGVLSLSPAECTSLFACSGLTAFVPAAQKRLSGIP